MVDVWVVNQECGFWWRKQNVPVLFVCLFVFADFCELVGGSCRQWFNFHEEFFFLFLLPPIILYPQKTEGEHFIVLLLACLLAHTRLFGSVSLSHIARTRMILMIP